MSHTERAYQAVNTWILRRLDREINATRPLSPDLALLKAIAQRERTAFVGWLNSEVFPHVTAQTQAKLIGIFDVYFLPMLRLFYFSNPGENSHQGLWNQLLSASPDFVLPIPVIYTHARKLILSPLGRHIRYEMTEKVADHLLPLQQKMAKYPKISMGLASMIIALNPSFFSMGVGLFSALSVFFHGLAEQRQLTKSVWNIAKNMFLFSLMGQALFPLMIIALVDQHFALPLKSLMILGGILVMHGVLEFQLACNIYHFEQANIYQIEGTRRALKTQLIKNTIAPFLIPAIGSMAISTALFLPKNIFFQGMMSLSSLYSGAQGLSLIANFLRRRGTSQEAVQLTLISFGILPYLIPAFKSFTGEQACQDISILSIFGIPTLSLPPSDYSLSQNFCHERSGALWRTQPQDSALSRFFTAHSLQHHYEIFPVTSEFPSSSDALALIPALQTSKDSGLMIDHFCELAGHDHCSASRVFRQLEALSRALPISYASRMGEAFHEGFKAALITTSENYEQAHQAAATVFVGMQIYQIAKNARPRQTSRPEASVARE
jgi:hypothetical protein